MEKIDFLLRLTECIDERNLQLTLNDDNDEVSISVHTDEGMCILRKTFVIKTNLMRGRKVWKILLDNYQSKLNLIMIKVNNWLIKLKVLVTLIWQKKYTKKKDSLH